MHAISFAHVEGLRTARKYSLLVDVLNCWLSIPVVFDRRLSLVGMRRSRFKVESTVQGMGTFGVRVSRLKSCFFLRVRNTTVLTDRTRNISRKLSTKLYMVDLSRAAKRNPDSNE